MCRLKILPMLLTVVVLMVSACAAPKVKTTALIPAQYHDAAKLKEVAVLPFDGSGGGSFSNEMEGVLGSVQVGGSPFFVLVDRQRIDKVLREQKFSQSGLVNVADIMRLGKMLGARGIFTGAITVSDVNDQRYREERQECTQREKNVDKNGNVWEGNCLRWRKYAVGCTRRDAVFSVSPKMIDVQTGRIVYASNLSETETASACEDSGTPVASKISLLEGAKRKTFGKIRNDIAPHYMTIEIQLMDSTDGIESKESKNLLKSGIEFAKKNRFDRACELWAEAMASSPVAPAIVYNAGICAELNGDFNGALDLYRKADRLLQKPDDRTSFAIGRIAEKMKNREKLKEQLERSK